MQIIFLFFFCLSPFVLLFSSVFFSQQNHKITPVLASITDLSLLPTTKSQNHLPSLNHRTRWYHPNTKTQKLKSTITHHRTSKNKMKSNSKINQNQDEVKWGPCSTTSRSEVAVVGRCNWGKLGLLATV